MKPMYRSLPKQLQLWRQHEGLTQAQLEERAQLGHNTVSRIERGETHPRTMTLEQLAQALGISFEQLLFSRPRDVSSKLNQINKRREIIQLIENLTESECENLYPLFLELHRFTKSK